MRWLSMRLVPGSWSRTLTFQFLLVVVVGAVPHVFLLGQDSTAFCGADRDENLVPRGGGLQGFHPRQASSASSAHLPSAADEAFTGEASHFSPIFKK